MDERSQPRYLNCLLKPSKSCLYDFFTLKSAIAFGCFLDIIIGALRLGSLVFRGHRHSLRVFQGVTAPLIAISAILCLVGLRRDDKLGLIKVYWKVKVLDAVLSVIATVLFYEHRCEDHECKVWMFVVYGLLRLGFNLLFSHLAWSAVFFIEGGHKLLVQHGPAVLELMTHQASSIAYAPVTIVEGQALSSVEAGARINT
jgi:hypothetical protein